MEKINKLIANEEFDKALEIINEQLADPKTSKTSDYHFLLFAKARIYIISYSNSKPIDNNLYNAAMKHFAMANTAHMTMHNEPYPDYQKAVDTAKNTYRILNQRIVNK